MAIQDLYLTLGPQHYADAYVLLQWTQCTYIVPRVLNELLIVPIIICNTIETVFTDSGDTEPVGHVIPPDDYEISQKFEMVSELTLETQFWRSKSKYMHESCVPYICNWLNNSLSIHTFLDISHVCRYSYAWDECCVPPQGTLANQFYHPGKHL